MTNRGLRRLIVVSNRLPFNAEVRNGVLAFRESTGGLVTGFSSFLATLSDRPNLPQSYLWIGWPGTTIDGSLKPELLEKADREFHSFPVFLTAEEMESFYLGFCNKTIWPLFHYFPTFTAYREDHWQQYRKVNEAFAEAVLQKLEPDDIVWVHDYHLMLLPAILKSRAPNTPVGYFHHIPFPSFEVFRLLPGRWRREILEGLLGADLIGFHTYDYSQHFLQSVLRILGYDHNLGVITLSTGIARVETFPMGIDFARFSNALQDPAVSHERDELRKSLSAARVILSVDRLDYSKGIPNRLEGFEALLESNRQFLGNVVLIMVVVPSRIGVDQYETMKKQIEEQVGRINGRFGTIGWTPILYQYRQLSFAPLTAMYNVSDVALVTPLRDGMNLVAKEYIASRSDESGTLVLSEMAGAAKELGEAIIINPSNREEIADALKEALEMPPEEQHRRNRIMRGRLRRYDVGRWANDFVEQLVATRKIHADLYAKLLTTAVRQDLIAAYRRHSSRQLFLDYDGTLVPIVRRPNLARPTEELIRLIVRLAQEPGLILAIVSGRDRQNLQQWFGDLPIRLVAEHGIWIREPYGEWATLKTLSNDWKPRIMTILDQYTDRLPGSFVEEKDYALAWHYRTADPEQSKVMVGEVKDHLVSFTANIDVQILQGKTVIEVRNAGINKGTAVQHWLGGGTDSFILAAGDDRTDEDLFAVLPPTAYTLKVGVTSTQARYNVRDQREIIRLLELLLKPSDM